MILILSNVDVYREIGIRYIFPIVCVEKLRKRSSKIGREQIFYGLNLSTRTDEFVQSYEFKIFRSTGDSPKIQSHFIPYWFYFFYRS